VSGPDPDPLVVHRRYQTPDPESEALQQRREAGAGRPARTARAVYQEVPEELLGLAAREMVVLLHQRDPLLDVVEADLAAPRAVYGA